MVKSTKFKSVEKYCRFCGNMLVLNNNRDICRKNFCSRSCSTKFYLGEEKIGMFGRHHTKESKAKMSESHPDVNGKNNPRYIDGRATFRKRLLEVIEYSCDMCGKKENLIAHHIIHCIRGKTHARSIIYGNHNIKNGVFLCASCHHKHHLGVKNAIQNI